MSDPSTEPVAVTATSDGSSSILKPPESSIFNASDADLILRSAFVAGKDTARYDPPRVIPPDEPATLFRVHKRRVAAHSLTLDDMFSLIENGHDHNHPEQLSQHEIIDGIPVVSIDAGASVLEVILRCVYGDIDPPFDIHDMRVKQVLAVWRTALKYQMTAVQLIMETILGSRVRMVEFSTGHGIAAKEAAEIYKIAAIHRRAGLCEATRKIMPRLATFDSMPDEALEDIPSRELLQLMRQWYPKNRASR